MTYRNSATGKQVFKNQLDISNFNSPAIISPSNSNLWDVTDVPADSPLFPASIFAPKKLISAGYGDLTADNNFVDLWFLWSLSKRTIGGGVPVAYELAPNDMTRYMRLYRTGPGPKDAFIALGQFFVVSSPFEAFSSLACYNCKTQELTSSFFNFALGTYPTPYAPNIPAKLIHNMLYSDYMATEVSEARPWSSAISLKSVREPFYQISVPFGFTDLWRAQDYKKLNFNVIGEEDTNYADVVANIVPIAGGNLSLSGLTIDVTSDFEAATTPSTAYLNNLYATGGTANTVHEWSPAGDPLNYTAEFNVDCTSSFTNSFPATGTPSNPLLTCDTEDIDTWQTLSGTCTCTLTLEGNSQPLRSVNGAVSLADEPDFGSVSVNCVDVTNYEVTIESTKVLFDETVGNYVKSVDPVVATIDFNTTGMADQQEFHLFDITLPDGTTRSCSYDFNATYSGTRAITNNNSTTGFIYSSADTLFPSMINSVVPCTLDLNISSTADFTVVGHQVLAVGKDFFVTGEVDYTVNVVSTWRTLSERYSVSIHSECPKNVNFLGACNGIDMSWLITPGVHVYELNSSSTAFVFYSAPATIAAWLFSGDSLFTGQRRDNALGGDGNYESRAFTATYTLTLNNGANYKTTMYARDPDFDFTPRELAQSWCSYSTSSYNPSDDIEDIVADFEGVELIPYTASTLNESLDAGRYVDGVYYRTYVGPASTTSPTAPTNAKSISDLVYDEHVAAGDKFILVVTDYNLGKINLWRCDFDKYTNTVTILEELGETANFLGINPHRRLILIITENKYEVAHLGALASDPLLFSPPMMQDENTFVYAPYVDRDNTSKLSVSPQYIDWYKYDSDTNLYVRQPLKKATVVKSNDTVDDFTLIATSAYVPN